MVVIWEIKLMARDNNWLSFSLSSMEMMSSQPSMLQSTSSDSHHFYSFADNFYANGITKFIIYLLQINSIFPFLCWPKQVWKMWQKDNKMHPCIWSPFCYLKLLFNIYIISSSLLHSSIYSFSFLIYHLFIIIDWQVTTRSADHFF